MKTDDELRSFFETKIKPGLGDIEKWRKKALRRAIMIDVLLVPPLLYGLTYCIVRMVRYAVEKQMAIDDLIFATFIVGPFLFAAVFVYYTIWRIVRSDTKVIKSGDKERISRERLNELNFKNQVIGKIVKFISPDLNYSPERREVSGREVLRCEIFPHTVFYPRGYIAEDFIEGLTGNTELRFFELSGNDAIIPEGKKPGSIDYTAFSFEKFHFLGMFGIVDFNKSFRGHTVVLPEKKLRQSEWMRGSGRELVKLEDPEFEKHFSVYGTDQIAARYILSTSLMKRITDFKKKIGRKLSLYFTENKFYVAISHKKDQFERSIYKSVYDFDRVKKFYNDLTIVTDIVEDLNLNTRIWLKEDEKTSGMFEISPEYKNRKKWIFRLLTFLFGFFGLHYLYIGRKGKALITFLITAAVFPLLIYVTIKNQGNGPSGFLLFLFAVIWYIRIAKKAYWIEQDSRGVPMS